VPAGKVSLTWGSEPGAIVIDWIERGGPAVGRPSRLGFGSRLLASALPKDRATVTLDYHVEGVRCRITLIVLPEFVAEDVARQMKTEPVAAEDQPAGEAKLTDESGQVRPLEVARLRHRCAELFRRGTISGHRRPTGSSAGGGTSLFGRFVVDNITSQDLNNLRVLACDLNGTTRG
jgi:hypothetical protein